MSEKKIIIIISIFILLIFFALSWRERQFETGAYRNGWWAISFDDPKGKNFTFTIDNESNKSQKFSWKAVLEENVVSEGSETVASLKKKTITPLLENINQTGKITIEVNESNGEKKEIYKIFN